MRRRICTILPLGQATAITLLCAASLSMFDARPAFAQSADDKAAAEALFDEGKKLFVAKKFAEACPKLEASQKLDPGIGNLLFLADCYEGLGRVASAWAAFREAAALSRAANQPDREKVARTRAAALDSKLHKLAIVVSTPDLPGLKIKRNESDLKKETWGAALPVDPGAHTITVTATGKKPWSTKVQIAEGPGSDTVTIPTLEDAPPEPVSPPPPSLAPVAPAAEPPPPAPFKMGSQHIAGLAVGGAGLVAVGVAGAFAGLAASANSTAKTACPKPKCIDQDGVDASIRAGTFADASTALFIAGGALVATGPIVFLTAPSSKPAAPAKERAWITPVLGPRFSGLSIGRTW